MAENVKLKDLYGDAKTYSGVDVVYLPDADNEKEIKVYTKRTVRQYSLHSSPTFEPIIPDAASGTFISDAAPGAVMEYPNGHYVGLTEDLNVIGGVANPNEDAGTAHSVIEIIITNPATRLLYTYESISSENLKKLPLLTSIILGTATFTVIPGWSKAIFNADNEIVSFEHLDDVSNIVFDVKFPTTTFVDDMVNAVMYEASQETKSVTVTQNGTSSIVPSKGKSGIAQLNLEVNVAGGGGTSVQPDYAQNNSTAADYIKNRPGGYTVENPAISKTIAASDYVSTAIGMVYKFSDVILPDEAIVGGTGKVTTVGSDGAATEHDISSIVFGSEDFGSRLYIVSIAGSTETLNIFSGASPIGDGVYFSAILQDTTVTAYISEFTTAAYSTTVEIPEKFTEVKPADWGASYGEDGYVAGRVGGYFLTETDFVKIMSGSYKYSWDGVIGDKETVDARINQPGEPLSFRYVKVSDETFAVLLSVGAHITAINTSNGKPAELAATRENLSIGMFGTISIDQVNKENPLRVPLVVISYSNHAMAEMGGTTVSFTQGIWFAQNLNNDGTAKGYVSELALSVESGKSYPFMPYEFVEQNPSTLTTDDQTLTDDQKLQVRTNIGTVEGTDKGVILSSSTAGSTKKFKITVDDAGTLTATEVTQ